MKPLWRLTATAVILGPTTGKFSAAAENMIFLFFFPATATAKNMWGILLIAADFVHQEMFPENLILNNQLPRLKVFLQTR